MTNGSQQRNGCHKVTGSGNTADPPCKLRADTILADRYAAIPLGVAIIILIGTPFAGSGPDWPLLATGVLAGGLLIPIVLDRTIGTGTKTP